MSDLNDEELRALLPGMRRFAASLTRDASAADDLVQSCLEKTLSRWHTKRPEGSLKAWLYAIMVRQFLDGRRRAGRVRRLLEAFGVRVEDGRPGEEAVIARSSLGAFDKLSADHRAVLSLVSVEGLSYQEAAQALDVPIGTVMSRLSRARDAYRALTEAEPAPARIRRVK
jgi:RNA polymerase sigma-70 factor (ECF subfamily)